MKELFIKKIRLQGDKIELSSKISIPFDDINKFETVKSFYSKQKDFEIKVRRSQNCFSGYQLTRKQSENPSYNKLELKGCHTPQNDVSDISIPRQNLPLDRQEFD